MSENYNKLISIFRNMNRTEQQAAVQDLTRICMDKEDKHKKNYIGVMECIMGTDIKKKGHDRSAAYARAVVSHVMIKDGYTESEIGRLLNRNHSTINHYKNIMNTVMEYPNQYKDVINLYEKYRNRI